MIVCVTHLHENKCETQKKDSEELHDVDSSYQCLQSMPMCIVSVDNNAFDGAGYTTNR